MSTNSSISEHIRVQSSSLLGNIEANIDDTDHYSADNDILNKVLSDPKVISDIGSFEDYLKYYNGNSNANIHEFVMALRIGLRIGAYYEIENHKQQ